MTDVHAEFVLLVEMLERMAAALHYEAKADRMSRRNIGAAGNSLQLIAKQLKQFKGET